MAIRVPLLLETVEAVIHRLDPQATAIFDPPGDQPSGYDPDFEEPVVFTNTSGQRQASRKELPPIRVPCQVEAANFERLRQLFPGNTPNSSIVLALSRIDLEARGLIDLLTRKVLINVNDRVETLERRGVPGQIVHPITPPGLFVFEVRPGSWGFGPDGHDLELLFLDERQRAG